MRAVARQAAYWLQVEDRRKLITELELVMKASPETMGPEALPPRHHFAPGAYARELEIPAGICIVGKIHRHAHINVISRGAVLVYTAEDGLLELEAPLTFVSKPGTKRAVVALTDVVWTTVHVTNETDLEAIEREIIAPSFAALEKKP